jgi:hypothetical protein
MMDPFNNEMILRALDPSLLRLNPFLHLCRCCRHI